MNVGSLGQVLRAQEQSALIKVPCRTSLFDVAKDNLGMTGAYLNDGTLFLSSGDLVNALAAFSYALGWLHYGSVYGLFVIQGSPCPFKDGLDRIPDGLSERLDEKTHRYKRLLDTAIAAVQPAAEEGTTPYAAADRALSIISLYSGQGSRFLARNQKEDALAFFSYGHGWLDAGVRSGLFSVHASRELFTI